MPLWRLAMRWALICTVVPAVTSGARLRRLLANRELCAGGLVT